MSLMINIEAQQRAIDQLRVLAKIAFDSKQYATLKESELLNLMLTAHALGIHPMKAINGGFHVVNGKVCMATALMADRIRKCGHSLKIIEMGIDKCVILGTRKDNKDEFKFEYTIQDAQLAQLTGSMTWKKYPKAMLYNRCMSQVARVLFPDVVGNCYSDEEKYDIENIEADKRPDEDPEVLTLSHVPQKEMSYKEYNDNYPSQNPCEVIVAKLPERLSDLQMKLLTSAIANDTALYQRICDWFKISDPYDMPAEKFEAFVKWNANQKKEVKNV